MSYGLLCRSKWWENFSWNTLKTPWVGITKSSKGLPKDKIDKIWCGPCDKSPGHINGYSLPLLVQFIKSTLYSFYFCLPPVTEEEVSGISDGFALRILKNIFIGCSMKEHWFSVLGPFINRRNANTFISPQQRWRAKAQERCVPQLDGGSCAIAEIWTEWERGLSLFLCLELRELKSKTEKTECLETPLLWG